MCWHGELPLPGDASAAGQARRFCSQRLRRVVGDGPDADNCVDDAVLVTSELVANAISADPSGAVLTIDVHRTHLHIAVEDGGLGEPQVQHPSMMQAHGRGVRIVDRLSREWGVTPTPAGKQVWADLTVPAHLTDHIRCRCAAR